MYKIFCGKDGRWRAYIPDKTKPTGRRMITAKTREILTERIDEIRREQYAQDITLRQLLDDWVEYKALHVSKPTLDRIMRDWRRYYNTAEVVDKPITAITKIDLDIWIHSVIQSYGLTRHSYANYHLIIKQMMDYAVDIGIIERSPLSDLRIKTAVVLRPERKPEDSTQVYSADELTRFRDLAWQEYRDKTHPTHTLIPLTALFLFYTGLRIGEVAALQWSDIDGDTLTVSRFYRTRPYAEVVDHTKGRYGARKVILVPPAVEILDEARRWQNEQRIRSVYIFAAKKKQTEYVYHAIQKKYYLYCKRLGCEKKSVHKARKTYISTLIDAGININTIRGQAGHLDERTTLGNYCFDRSSPEEKRDEISAVFVQNNPKITKK